MADGKLVETRIDGHKRGRRRDKGDKGHHSHVRFFHRERRTTADRHTCALEPRCVLLRALLQACQLLAQHRQGVLRDISREAHHAGLEAFDVRRHAQHFRGEFLRKQHFPLGHTLEAPLEQAHVCGVRAGQQEPCEGVGTPLEAVEAVKHLDNLHCHGLCVGEIGADALDCSLHSIKVAWIQLFALGLGSLVLCSSGLGHVHMQESAQLWKPWQQLSPQAVCVPAAADRKEGVRPEPHNNFAK